MSNETLPDLRPDQLIDLAKQPRVQPLDLPELGGRVYVLKLTGKELDRFEAMPKKTRSALVQMGIGNADGSKLFTAEHAKLLDDCDGDVIHRMASAVLEFNSMGLQGKESLKKNSDSSPIDASGSSSASSSESS